MIPEDLAYVRTLLDRAHIASPCMELGAGLDGHNLRTELERRGIDWYGSDIRGDGDRVVAMDFDTEMPATLAGRTFASVLLLNVVEHTFDPLGVMDRALGLVRPGGTLVVVAPTIWDLHYFPLDCWRMNPGFLTAYAERRGLTIVPETFRWIMPRQEMVRGDRPALPRSRGLRLVGEKVANRALNALGLGRVRPSAVSVGCVFRRAAAAQAAQ